MSAYAAEGFADSCALRRHGDKAKEMALLSLTTYGQAAEKLIMHNPLTFKRVAFVSSEDPDVIRDAQNITTFGVNGADLACLAGEPLGAMATRISVMLSGISEHWAFVSEEMFAQAQHRMLASSSTRRKSSGQT